MILLDNKSPSFRLIKKVYFLLYDFIINDQAIFVEEDKCFVRRSLSENEEFIDFTMKQLDNENDLVDT